MFLKRAFFSLRHNWWKNLLLILLFASLFAVAIGSLTLYGTTKAQSDHLQKALGNAVTLRGIQRTTRTNYSIRGVSGDMPPGVMSTFLQSPLVEDYNFDKGDQWKLDDTKGLYEDIFQDFENFSILGTYVVHAMGMMDSSLHPAFTTCGFQLIEGEHLRKEMLYEDVCLVSRPFAEFNGLHVGDRFQVHSAFEDELYPEKEPPEVELSIRGIFEPPESDYERRAQGDSPEELIFTTPGSIYHTRTHKEEIDIRYGWATAFSATVYLSSPEDVDVFVEETKKKFPIRDVVTNYYQHPREGYLPEELLGLPDEEWIQWMDDHAQYDLYVDREWYDMVGGPWRKPGIWPGSSPFFCWRRFCWFWC